MISLAGEWGRGVEKFTIVYYFFTNFRGGPENVDPRPRTIEPFSPATKVTEDYQTLPKVTGGPLCSGGKRKAESAGRKAGSAGWKAQGAERKAYTPLGVKDTCHP